MRAKRPSVLRGIISGAAAGITATLIMDQFFKLTSASQKAVEKQMKLAQGESRSEIAHEQIPQEQETAHHEDSTEIVARKLAKATGKTLDQEQKKTAGRAVHYTFGTLMGIVYGVSAELVPEATTGGGTGFGTLLFFGADELAVPAFQLSPAPAPGAPGFDHLQHDGGHHVALTDGQRHWPQQGLRRDQHGGGNPLGYPDGRRQPHHQLFQRQFP